MLMGTISTLSYDIDGRKLIPWKVEIDPSQKPKFCATNLGRFSSIVCSVPMASRGVSNLIT